MSGAVGAPTPHVRLGIAQSELKSDCQNSIVEAVSVHIYTANIVMP